MSNEKFHGAFVFRNQGHGILSSTYFNTQTPKPYPEIAILTGEGNESNAFLGRFETVWIEATRNVHGHITISRNQNYQLGFDLRWAEDDRHVWEGIGNMEKDFLVGCYWEADTH